MIQSKQPPRPVLIFNSRKKLVFVAASVYEAAKYGQVKPGNISKTCNGQSISNKNYYFRYIDTSIEIEFADIGTLTLEEYDRLCGVSRPLYTDAKMSRKNWKYKKKTK